MKRRILHYIYTYFLWTVLLLSTSCACETEESPYELNETDRTFITYLYSYNEYKIQATTLATQNGKTATQTVAAEILGDLEQTRTQLQTIATNTRYTLPVTIPADAASDLSTLQNATIASFDITFTQDQLTTINADIAMLENELSHGTEPSVMALAHDYLPKLRQHKVQLTELLGKL